jgi:snurportin-1
VCANPTNLTSTCFDPTCNLQRRAERFDSSRQLDLFADLNLGRSDDEDENGDVEPVREGLAQFASLLPPTPSGTSTFPKPVHPVPQEPRSIPDSIPTEFSYSKRKGKNKRKGKACNRGDHKAQLSKPNNKWADQCMYAELLEMTEDTEMSDFDASQGNDGIPTDLESGWVAVTPVPAGKRCLAITHAPSGVAGLGTH